MHIERHGWYSSRLGRDMNMMVYGHYGLPILVFPTSGGDETEWEGFGSMIPALAHHLDAGKVKIFCINSINNDISNRNIHPGHRTWLLSQFDAYVIQEVVPFIRNHVRSLDTPITTTGASLGAFHAANMLLKHPDVFKRCLAMSGVYDIRDSFDGYYDDFLYFNNPMDYVSNLSDPWFHWQLQGCDLRLSTGNGPYEHPQMTYNFSDVLRARGISHSVDNWGADGGHDWPYWRKQMNEYIGKLY